MLLSFPRTPGSLQSPSAALTLPGLQQPCGGKPAPSTAAPGAADTCRDPWVHGDRAAAVGSQAALGHPDTTPGSRRALGEPGLGVLLVPAPVLLLLLDWQLLGLVRSRHWKDVKADAWAGDTAGGCHRRGDDPSRKALASERGWWFPSHCAGTGKIPRSWSSAEPRALKGAAPRKAEELHTGSQNPSASLAGCCGAAFSPGCRNSVEKLLDAPYLCGACMSRLCSCSGTAALLCSVQLTRGCGNISSGKRDHT